MLRLCVDTGEEHQERRVGFGPSWAKARGDGIGAIGTACPFDPIATGGRPSAVIEAYVSDGWACDERHWKPLLKPLRHWKAHRYQRRGQFVRAVVLDKSARHFQSLVGSAGTELRKACAGVPAVKETCLLFVDGCDFDLGGVL